MLDVLTIGNALIDAFLTIHNASEHCHLEECELSFRLGEKIPLDTCDFQLGGNAANVSVGIKRLGFASGLTAEVGRDLFATHIMKLLQDEAIDMTQIQQTETQSSFAIGVSYQNDRILFVEHRKKAHEFSFDQVQTNWVYLTSLGDDWHDAYQRAVTYCRDRHVKLAFSPGTLQLGEGLAFLQDALIQTKILFLNKEEGQRLVGGNVTDVRELMSALHAKGPEVVVVTDGAAGSYVLDKTGESYHLEICPGPIVERTGAGDAYATGFLAAYMLGMETPTAMKWGTVNASHVIRHIGAQPGLLTRDVLEQELREQKELIAKKL